MNMTPRRAISRVHRPKTLSATGSLKISVWLAEFHGADGAATRMQRNLDGCNSSSRYSSQSHRQTTVTLLASMDTVSIKTIPIEISTHTHLEVEGKQ